ncbi:MAG TPA: cytochrome P450, partial [Candidatus Synoicihabitans sp.]|nr:cytochrome P450 [Candidatus Synoicihabitans sp.]
RRHRRLAQPVFHHRRLVALTDTMSATVEEVAARWEEAATVGRTLDLGAEMNRLTFLIVGRCLFGAELGPRADSVEQAFPVLLKELFQRAESAFSFPIWLPTARHRRFKQALATVDTVVDEVIAQRRGASADRVDLLSLLLEARDEDGSAISDEELRNHTITFLLAGHETTSSTLTWTFALLALHPEVRSALERELDTVLGHGSPTLDTLGSLRLLDAVLRESLRLYPSIWIAERRVVADDTLGGYDIPGGSMVVLAPYATHRLAAQWPEPDVFRPERFLERAELPTVEQGYFPFGAGPHQCIGQHFAVLEAKLALAILLRRFRVDLIEPRFPPPLGGITLRPRDAVPIRVSER